MALALCFFLAGCGLLVGTGPSLGALHAFAAFIVLAAVAATNQLIPVLTRAAPIGPLPVIVVGCAFAVGFTFLIAAFFGTHTFGLAGIVLLTSALFWVAWTLFRLVTGKAETQTRIVLGLAAIAFSTAAVIGAGMAGALNGSVSTGILAAAPAHATLAILGFATLLIVTISYRFVPMFALAHDTAYGLRLPQWVFLLAVTSVIMLLHQTTPLRLALFVLLIAAVWMAGTHARTLSSRLRKRLDISLRYAIVAWSAGLLALIAAIAGTFLERFTIAAIVLALLGWVSISILGYAYKVAGFLAWQFARERAKGVALPPLGSAVDERLARIALALLALGALGAGCGWIANPRFANLAFGVYSLGGLCASLALGKLALKYVAVPYVAR